jgi:hypothetical protein
VGEPTAQPISRSAHDLGRNLRRLREILRMEPVDLARIIGCPTGTAIERYESGLEEIPQGLCDALESRLLVNPKFLVDGKMPVFRGFNLGVTDECRALLDSGFSPVLLCAPPGQDLGRAFVVFRKKRDGWEQVAVSDRCGSFVSMGGGRANLRSLAYAMLRSGKSHAQVLSVCGETWESLAEGRYYPGPAIGLVNPEFEDAWFEILGDCRRALEDLPRELVC